MILLGHLWHFVVDSWRAPKRARVLYLLFSAGFVTMAIAGAIRGDALVTGVAAFFAVITTAIAVLAPRLSPLLAPRPEEPETFR